MDVYAVGKMFVIAARILLNKEQKLQECDASKAS